MSGSEGEERAVRRRYRRSRSRSPRRSVTPHRSPRRSPRRSPHRSRTPRGSRSPRRSRSRGRSRSGGSQTPGHRISPSPTPSVGTSEGEASGEQGNSVETPDDSVPMVVSFCYKHKNDLVPDECVACEAIAKANGTVSADTIPPANVRFSRGDEKPPTLTLRDSTIDLMCNVFTSGRFKIPNYFEVLLLLNIFHLSSK